jgi:hypothetical protein
LELIMRFKFMLPVILVILTLALPGMAKNDNKGYSPDMNVSLNGKWLIVTDPGNVGQEQKWWSKPAADAKETKVPWIIQDAYPGYHGVAWYWKEFTASKNPYLGGRSLLRFGAVDHKADVWVNDIHVGTHENAEIPFTFDVTDAIKPNAVNRIAVRVLNPSFERIDGLVMADVPHRHKNIPYTPGAAANHGGITDSVNFVQVPAVRVEDVFCRPDWKTGVIRIQTTVINAGKRKSKGSISFEVAPAASGQTITTASIDRDFPVGTSVFETKLKINDFRLWSLNDPYLYRVTTKSGASELSTRCGFRDFRLVDGYFKLNGKRVFLKGSHSCNHFPVGLQVPGDPDFARRDLIYAKMAGFNCIRFIAGMPTTYQLDLCDELGLMVYDENYASWCLGDSPRMAEMYDRSFTGMITRDRNHPSVVIWGMLNETGDGPVFRHAVASIPLVRSLDDTRMMLLDSGRFDLQLNIGSICNPGSKKWECILGNQSPDAKPASWSPICGYIEGAGDIHCYPGVPQPYDIIHLLRTMGKGEKNHVFVSEYGIGSAVNWPKVYRQYEQLGKTEVEDAQFYKRIRDRFMEDWNNYKMADTWATPDEYLDQCIAKMSGQRRESLNAIRSNPDMIGHSMTGTMDQGMTGEGLWTIFRDLKPGTMDALHESWAPLKWCLFAQPENVYSGSKVKLEAVLVNEDVLLPGNYPVRIQVVGPDGVRVLDKTVNITITGSEMPFAIPVFSEEVPITGPTGKYRFLVQFESGASATCEEATLYVTNPIDMPAVDTEVVLWGDDPELAKWLTNNGIKTKAYTPGAAKQRELILIGSKPAPGGAEGWQEIITRITQGSAVVYLCPEVFAEGDHPTHWLPLVIKGSFTGGGDLYNRDEWAKNHPVFDGLPTGLLDYTYYREIIPFSAFTAQAPTEIAAGAIRASIHPSGYASGFLTGVYRTGAGMYILNSLKIRENLGKNPVAERLLRNMLTYASKDLNKPLSELPGDWDGQLKAIGYK